MLRHVSQASPTALTDFIIISERSVELCYSWVEIVFAAVSSALKVKQRKTKEAGKRSQIPPLMRHRATCLKPDINC